MEKKYSVECDLLAMNSKNLFRSSSLLLLSSYPDTKHQAQNDVIISSKNPYIPPDIGML